MSPLPSLPFVPRSASCHVPFAHALVAKQDLPIPAWLFAWAASIVLIVSFFALSAAWRTPQFEDERWRPSAAWLSTSSSARPSRCSAARSASSSSASPPTPASTAPKRRIATSRSPSSSSPSGSASPSSPCFRRHLPPLQPLAGDGPCRRRRLPPGRRPAPGRLAYPARIGRWPAALGLLAFVWFEVVYGSSGGVSVGLDPHAAGGPPGLHGSTRWR